MQIKWYDEDISKFPYETNNPTRKQIEEKLDTLDTYQYRTWLSHSRIIPKRLRIIRDIIGEKKCLEVGAGRGLYSYLIDKDIIVTDINPPEFVYGSIEKLSAVDAVAKYKTECLMIIWPLCDSMASDCLEKFDGNIVIYIGQGKGKMDGDDRFFDLLENNFTLNSVFHGKEDSLFYYT